MNHTSAPNGNTRPVVNAMIRYTNVKQHKIVVMFTSAWFAFFMNKVAIDFSANLVPCIASSSSARNTTVSCIVVTIIKMNKIMETIVRILLLTSSTRGVQRLATEKIRMHMTEKSVYVFLSSEIVFLKMFFIFVTSFLSSTLVLVFDNV